MSEMDRGLELVRQACEAPQAVPAAQQTLRNWQHKLDRSTVLDAAGRSQVQKDICVLVNWLGRVHLDPVLFANRHADAERQIESLRRRLTALVGARGLD